MCRICTMVTWGWPHLWGTIFGCDLFQVHTKLYGRTTIVFHLSDDDICVKSFALSFLRMTNPCMLRCLQTIFGIEKTSCFDVSLLRAMEGQIIKAFRAHRASGQAHNARAFAMCHRPAVRKLRTSVCFERCCFWSFTAKICVFLRASKKNISRQNFRTVQPERLRHS